MAIDEELPPEMKSEASKLDKTPEQLTSDFYNSVGWVTTDGVTEDARRDEDLRESARQYVSKCRLRITRHVGSGERILDMASGPIQYDEYRSYSANFKQRYCVDLSADALNEARRKLGDHGVYLHGSFFNMDFPDDYFDCAVSLHTIYHIAAEEQEAAVRKLLRITKPGKPVIIVYSNPRCAAEYARVLFQLPGRIARKVLDSVRSHNPTEHAVSQDGLYFFPHPLAWFRRFSDVADVSMLPWRSFAVRAQEKLFPNNRVGAWLLDRLFGLEDRFPRFFVRVGQYPMVILTKRPG